MREICEDLSLGVERKYMLKIACGLLWRWVRGDEKATIYATKAHLIFQQETLDKLTS